MSKFIESLTLLDVFLIISAMMFFAVLGYLGNILGRRSIIWAAIFSLIVLGYHYKYELAFLFLVLTK